MVAVNTLRETALAHSARPTPTDRFSDSGPVPIVIDRAGANARKRFLEFFTATIRNENTRMAYARAVGSFFVWCQSYRLELLDIEPIHVAAYIERHPGAPPTVKQHLAAIRMLTAAIKQREVDERIELDDAQVLSVIEKMSKQRRESIAQFKAGGRADLVAKEEAELALLSAYLPAQLGDAELDAMIAEAITATGAASIKDMGKVMALLRERFPGQMDFGKASGHVKSRLG